MDYLDLDLGSLDAEELRQDGRDFMQAQAPAGWRINPFLDWLLGAVARMVVILVTLAQQVPKAIFTAFGISVLRVPMISATYATATITLNANAGSGGSLDAGATIVIDGVGFVTTAASGAVAAAGTATVPVQAVVAGAGGTGLTGTSVQLSSPAVTWIDTITLTAPTDGGFDGETADQYVDRLPDEIGQLSPKAILLEDVAATARADLEVYRALALRHYVPAGPGGTPPAQTGVEGAVAIALITQAGDDVSDDAEDRVEAAIVQDDNRIVSVTAYVIKPTRTAVKVSYTGQVFPGQDPALAEETGNAGLMSLLSGVTWGVPGDGAATDWIDEDVVMRNDLIGALYRTGVFRHISDLKLALVGNALGTLDLTLPGPAAIPELAESDIAATVTA